MRIGHGYDVHKFAINRKLYIGGIEIPFELGLDGHSDADVLIHAICDSLLGAAALGDIGRHFPDYDERYKNIDSKILLKYTVDLVAAKGYSTLNIDATVIAQKPKLLPFIQDIRKILSSICKIDIDNINIKATTEEGLGFTGELKGISAHAVCLID